MNLCDSAFPHANDAVRKIGLFTRLPINRLNLLHDSEQGHAPGGGVRPGVFALWEVLAVRVLDKIVRRVCPAERVALP